MHSSFGPIVKLDSQVIFSEGYPNCICIHRDRCYYSQINFINSLLIYGPCTLRTVKLLALLAVKLLTSKDDWGGQKLLSLEMEDITVH